MTLSPEAKDLVGAISAPAEPARADRATRMAECLRRARSGETSALDEAVEELNPLLWHVARSQGLPTQDAADVVQTTWLELLRRLEEIRSPQALIAWLVTTTKREAWHVMARQRRESGPGSEVLTEMADPAPGPPERFEADERYRRLWFHFQRLPERCRTLLHIVAFVDRPDYAVVAEALGLPRGSIGPTRGRCLSKLRAKLMADPSWSAR